MTSVHDAYDHILKSLSEELGEPTRISGVPKKKQFAIISGILPDSTLKTTTFPGFSDFFDRIIDVTFNTTTSTSGPDQNKANHLFKELLLDVKKYVEIEEDDLEKLLQVDDIVEAIKYDDVEKIYPQFNRLALDVFGGHIEIVFLLCMSSLDPRGERRDSKALQDLIEKRFGETDSQTTTAYLKNANRIFDYLGVAPVYVKGIHKADGLDYLTLQLVSKLTNGMDRLHSTFSILVDSDTANPPGLGTYHQVKLYSGMKELRKGPSDILPILLDNAKLLPSKENLIDFDPQVA